MNGLTNISPKEEIFLSTEEENAGIAELCRVFLTRVERKRSLLAEL